MSTQKTQLVVFGAGPGGYAAAFFAADQGLQVTLIDKNKDPGGVCLYKGCIPSKALLHVAKLLNEAREASAWGIDFGQPKIDIKRVREWKNNVIAKMTGGLGILSKQRNITYIQGTGKFLNSNTICVTKEDGSEEIIEFEKAILATGSQPTKIPAFDIGSDRIIDSTGALALEDIPKKMLVVGGGYIGLELGTVYSALGTEVTVVEMMPALLPGADQDLIKVLASRIKEILHKILLGTRVVEMKEMPEGILVKFDGENLENTEEIYDKVLISVGRTPVTKELGLENTQVTVTERGFVQIDEKQATTDPNIWAIGDIAGDPMLAHKASHEGRVAVEALLGRRVAFEPAAIPAVVFTDPEIAWCGITENEAKEKGIPHQVARFPWGASGRATTLDRNDGMTKLIVDPETKRILGMGIAGVGAGELIAEGVLAVEMAAVATDLAMSIHAHPTLSETVMESAEALFGYSTHIYRPKKA